MSFVVWVVVGIGAGLLANLVATHFGPVEDLIVSVTGSVAAGWAFVAITGTSVTLATPQDGGLALAGALTFLAVSRQLTRGRSAI